QVAAIARIPHTLARGKLLLGRFPGSVHHGDCARNRRYARAHVRLTVRFQLSGLRLTVCTQAKELDITSASRSFSLSAKAEHALWRRSCLNLGRAEIHPSASGMRM